MTKAKKHKVYIKSNFDESLLETINWYKGNKKIYKKRYNSFHE